MALTDTKKAKQCADALQALGEPNRIRVVELLMAGPKNVGEIAKAINCSMVNTSHHLRVLRNAGLVEDVKDGWFVIYSLHPNFVTAKGTTSLDLGWCKVEIAG
jgi:ArsR family transcriptional regulator